jgi:branched-subunit amino acid ABC-type transport system permease component
MVDEALDSEERELLRSIGEEPGFFSQAFNIFRGRTGWVNIVMMIAQGVLFIAGAWAAWHFFKALEPVAQLRWGLPAAVLLIVASIMKMALLPRMEANRLMREMKRIELQIACITRS